MFGISLRGFLEESHTVSAGHRWSSITSCFCAVADPYKTIEIPHLLVDTMADVPFVLVVQVLTVPCIWQSIVRCWFA